MPLIRFAAVYPKEDFSKKTFEVMALPLLAYAIKKKIRQGQRCFLMNSLSGDRAINKIAQAIADLKMARPEIDIHFVDSTIKTGGCLP